MANENFYQNNLETGKLNIHTNKAFYDALDAEQQKVFRSYCLWSGRQQCWVSKGKAENCGQLKVKLNGMGFEQRDAIGEKPSFEQKIEREQQHALQRSERADQRSAHAESTSDILYSRAKDMASVIPFGQPILVGHHSEKRDRNYRGRIEGTFKKAFEESDKAAYYAGKAAEERRVAEGGKYRNPDYLTKKIRQTETSIRQLERRLLGKQYPHSPEKEISETARLMYNGRLAEENEKLQFYQKCMRTVNPDWKPNIAKSQKNKGKSI